MGELVGRIPWDQGGAPYILLALASAFAFAFGYPTQETVKDLCVRDGE